MSDSRTALRRLDLVSLLRVADRIVPPLSLVVLAAVFVWTRARDPLLPTTSPTRGWETWYDQHKYLEATQAWLAGDLQPLHHWYMPGYPLLGAVFSIITPGEPYFVPNLVCLLAAGWLLARLGAGLAGLGGATLGALAFLGSTALSGTALEIWIVPWSSTPVAPLAFALLLAAVRFAERPCARDALFAGLAAGAIPWFRPTDLVVVAAPAGLLMGWALLRGRAKRHLWVRVSLAGLLGLAIPLMTLVAVHICIFGFAPGGYLDISGHYGFAWALIPLRWVTLVVDPEPLFPGYRSLIMVFPWIVPGLAGAIACIVAPPRGAGRAAHLSVVAALALQIALLLAYTDINLFSLLRYNNYHYFKWVLPLLGLYASLLILAFTSRARRVGAIVGCLGAAVLICWRPELADVRRAEVVRSAHELFLPGGLPSVWDTLYVPAFGHPTPDGTAEERIFSGTHRIEQGNRPEEVMYDFRLFPVFGGLMLTPLRTFLPGDLRLETGPETELDGRDPAWRAMQRIAFRPPCLILHSRRPGCRPVRLLPPPYLEPDQTVRFDGGEAPYLGSGWSGAEPTGRWTDGREAMLILRVSGLKPGDGLLLDAEVGGYVPLGDTHKLDAGVIVNNQQVADWHLESGTMRAVQARIPGRLIPLGGELDITFHIENPRQPVLNDEGPDRRQLGLHVQSLRFAVQTADASP